MANNWTVEDIADTYDSSSQTVEHAYASYVMNQTSLDLLEDNRSNNLGIALFGSL